MNIVPDPVALGPQIRNASLSMASGSPVLTIEGWNPMKQTQGAPNNVGNRLEDLRVVFTMGAYSVEVTPEAIEELPNGAQRLTISTLPPD